MYIEFGGLGRTNHFCVLFEHFAFSFLCFKYQKEMILDQNIGLKILLCELASPHIKTQDKATVK